jgi:RNase P/RNase MRP subunit p29
METWLPQSAEQVLGIIVAAEKHRKFVWTAGRVLKESALWTRVEAMDFERRKVVLKRLTVFLEELAARACYSGVTNRRALVSGARSGSITFVQDSE